MWELSMKRKMELIHVQGFVDSDNESCLDTRKSLLKNKRVYMSLYMKCGVKCKLNV